MVDRRFGLRVDLYMGEHHLVHDFEAPLALLWDLYWMVPVALVEVVLVEALVATTELPSDTSDLQVCVPLARNVDKSIDGILVPNVLSHHKFYTLILPWLFPSSAVVTSGMAELPFSTRFVFPYPLASPDTVPASHCLLMKV